MWDLESGKLWRIRVGVSTVRALAWSPDGKTLAVYGDSYSFEPDWRRDPLWREPAVKSDSGVWLVTGW